MKNTYLMIIPARGGSKGLPQKNVRRLAGKPLIAWSIEAAKKAYPSARVLVSTDSEKILRIAKRSGAEAPFKRPARLATDSISILPTLQHAVSWLEKNENYKPEIIVLLQPTSPLRRPEHIRKAIDLLRKSKADSVLSVCPTEHSPYWMKKLKGNKVFAFVKGKKEYFRRQNLPPVYRINGAVYATRYRELMKRNRVLGKDTRAIVMDSESSVDIDTAFDFKIAEMLLRERKNARR